jgi:serine/threonine-protein kinase RsbW
MEIPLHIEITLNSRVDLTNLVHAASDEVCRLAGLDEDVMLNLGLAVREATVNAMKHGNDLRAGTSVRITFRLDGQRLTVDVEDQGKGFDFEKDVDPRLPENLDKTSGRGIFLMRNFVDDVRFSRNAGRGTTVSLIKNLPRQAARRVRRA